ncbi:MAG: hypothetical protein HDS65_09740 [Bacteroidales bacterium]|nr:hypothetical protein [Bacteroidales bacterium]
MTRRILYTIAALLAMTIAGGCIKNDIPYARIQANFLTLTAKGQDAATVIDSTNRTVSLVFPEEVDIYSVQVTGYTLTPGAHIVDNPFTAPVDLSSPLFVYLRLYQDWLWKISAVQNIERYFEVEGEMGETVIDVPGRRVVLAVRSTTDLSKVVVKAAKLGQKGCVMTPDLKEGSEFDARSPFKVKIEIFGSTEEWTIYVSTVNDPVRTASADAWTGVAWVTGEAEAGLDNGVEYRIKGTQEWTRVPESEVTHNGGSFTARINHLSPLTTYETRAYSGTDYANVLEFTTGSTPQIPNGDFDYWWLDKKVWCPWPEGGEQFWDTGNKGATTIGTSNTFPSEDTPSGSGYAACLETRFVGIGVLGKLAAGNIFAGSYVRTDGTNGVLSFGRPFTERPTRMTGMFKYKSVPINYSNSETAFCAGQPDTCIVWVALIDSPQPFEIRTNPNNRQLFDPEGSYVVAYGKMQCGETVGSYTPFEVQLDYKSTSRVPTYILITGSASKYGDYFTGGAGSTLFLDDLKLFYDYQ